MASALKNLWSNVGRKPLLGFLVVPLGTAAVLLFIPFGDVFKIALYGLITFAWALIFAVSWGPAPGRAADFWYYTFGAIGVILFFVNSADQREKVALAQDYSLTTTQRATTVEKRQAVERIVQNSAQIIATIRKSASDYVKNLEDPQVRQSCIERDIQKRNDKLRNRSTGGGLAPPDISVPLPIDATCDQIVWLPSLQALAAATTAEQIAHQMRSTGDSPLRYVIGVRFDPLPLNEALGYLVDLKLAGEAINQMHQEEDGFTNHLAEIKTHYQSVGRAFEPGTNADTGALQYFLWPYFILTALGLKLARVNYCGENRVD
jgi:hypothetical protein